MDMDTSITTIKAVVVAAEYRHINISNQTSAYGYSWYPHAVVVVVAMMICQAGAFGWTSWNPYFQVKD